MTENFLLGFTDLCRGTEIPQIFAAWSGIAGVSCALGRKCFLDMGTFVVYPNLYICLVGGSGMVRKSTSIGMIERILRRINPGPNIIAQKITPEGLIDALRLPNIIDPTRLLATNSTGFVLVDELATFLNKSSYEAGLAALLISFFDCKDSFEYRTKGGGSQKIDNVCLGMLSASTVDWITNAIPENAVGGGLTSRFVFVYVDKAAPPVARPEWGEEKKVLEEVTQNNLSRIGMLDGPFKLTPDAWEFYDTEYIRFRESKEGTKLYNDKTLYGYASRRHMHQLKIAMCFSASDRSDRLVELKHIKGATELLATTEIHLPMLMSLITSTEHGTMMNLLLGAIRSRERVSRQELLRLVGHKIGARDMDAILETLQIAGWVQAVSDGRNLYYQAITS